MVASILKTLFLQIGTLGFTLASVMWLFTLKYTNVAKAYAPDMFNGRYIFTALWLVFTVLFLVIEIKQRKASVGRST